jgi:Fe-S-cluster containining protein
MVSCLRCDGNCCKRYFVTLTDTDVIRLFKSGSRLNDILDWIPVPSVYSTYPDVRLETGYHYMALKRKVDGACILSTRVEGAIRCGVHGNHPMLCRLFPYSLSGTLIGNTCLMSTSKKLIKPTITSGNSELCSYHKMVEYWNRNRITNRSTKEFIRFLLSTVR